MLDSARKKLWTALVVGGGWITARLDVWLVCLRKAEKEEAKGTKGASNEQTDRHERV